MDSLRGETCCFSGYRIEKMPFRTDDSPAASALREALDRAIRHAAGQGYTRFLSGMSTGFDLWAAEAVLRTRAQLPVQPVQSLPARGGRGILPVTGVSYRLLCRTQPVHGGRGLPADLLL